MEGVVRTTVGYAGGTTERPDYQHIGDHTETIEIEFDPAVVTYEDLLLVFWSEHDPLRPAWSRQYRSVVFYHDDDQRRAAEGSRDRVQVARGQEVQTAIEPAGAFTRAEDYHQKYRLRGDRALLSEYAAIYHDPQDFCDSTSAARANGFLGGAGTLGHFDRIADRLGLSEEGVEHLREIVERNAKRGRIFRCS
jgi:methionine-S-sulfoxide reductase